MTQKLYLVPCAVRAEGNDAYALEVLSQILGGSRTSRLDRALTLGSNPVAVSSGSWYWNDALDIGQFGLYASPVAGIELDALDRAMDSVVAVLHDSLVDAKELERAKTRLIADMIYAQDSQMQLARMYGSTLTTGGKVEDVARWSESIRAVTAEDIQRVAQRYLIANRAVSGHLTKDAA